MSRILVVDDEPRNLQAINRFFLDEDDISLDFAADGTTALAKIATLPPDLVLLDIMMPGLNGYEICRRIKADAATSDIMVLMVSGQAALDDRLKGYEVSADDYITKPYEPEELKAKVAILLRLKKLQDELRETNLNLEDLVRLKTKELIKKERQAVIGQLVQGIVHNLKTPLTGLKGFSELAKEELEKCLEQKEEAIEKLREHMHQSVGHIGRCLDILKTMDQLINNLLIKSRKDATTEKTQLNLNEVLAAELDFLQADMIIKHKIIKTLHLDPDPPTILGVYSDFSQIFCNLIQNAKDAMHTSPNKELTISSTHDDTRIILQFRDTGPGFPAEHIDKIFEPFFSTKATESDQEGRNEPIGTGLGLYTCAEIINSYGGEIRAEATPGQGACITLLIPYARQERKNISGVAK